MGQPTITFADGRDTCPSRAPARAGNISRRPSSRAFLVACPWPSPRLPIDRGVSFCQRRSVTPSRAPDSVTLWTGLWTSRMGCEKSHQYQCFSVLCAGWIVRRQASRHALDHPLDHGLDREGDAAVALPASSPRPVARAIDHPRPFASARYNEPGLEIESRFCLSRSHASCAIFQTSLPAFLG